jgi:hypothetical protein
MLGDTIEENMLKPTRSHMSQGTRWIGHRLVALKVLDRNFKSVQMVFEDLGSGLGNCDMVYSPRNKFLAKP